LRQGQPGTVDLACEDGSRGRPFQGGELLSARDILENQLVMSTGSHRERATEQQNQFQHSVILSLRAMLIQTLLAPL
jgi:hypothetical protein